MHGARKKCSCLLTSKFPKSDMASVSLLSLLLLDGCNQTIHKVIYKFLLSFQQMAFSIGNYFSFEYYLVIKHRQIEGKTSVQCVFTLENLTLDKLTNQ